jgi:hypothetical protein
MKTVVRPIIHHSQLTMPLSLVMELNREMPADGLGLILDQIRRDHGSDAIVSICAQCKHVDVLQIV